MAPDPFSVATPPSPLASVPSPLRAAMARRGFTALTPIQRAVLDPALSGRCLRLSSQTGSGKTAALGMVIHEPLVSSPGATSSQPRVLIVTPTRELAVQVKDELTWLYADLEHVFVGVVTGGVDIARERRMLARGPAILVGTPGRLLDHARSKALRFDDIEHVVLDEADRMLDMGFREELESLTAQLPAGRLTHLVSATFPPHVRRLADAIQEDALHLEGTGLGDANPDIEHIAHLVAPDAVFPCLVNALLLRPRERVLVFVERRCDATSTAEALVRQGFSAQSFSGDLSQAQRTRALESFRHGSTQVLVCTDVAARGIDVPDIAMVVHAAMPGDAESFIHRAGRTGRAGARGVSLALVPGRAKFYAERMARTAKIQFDWRPPPSPAKVRKQLRKRSRKALVAALDAATPSPEQLESAKSLLEDRDPAVVVATLLAQLRDELPCEPMSVREGQPPAPHQGRPPRKRGFKPRGGPRRGPKPRPKSRGRGE